MHELHLAEDVLTKIKEEAVRQGLRKVSYAKVGVGRTRVSHEAELLELFSMVAKGTVAEGIKLEIEIIPLKAVCADCQKDFTPQMMRLDCQHCGSTNIQMISGNELIIKELR